MTEKTIEARLDRIEQAMSRWKLVEDAHEQVAFLEVEQLHALLEFIKTLCAEKE